jgi:hypothetical protein
MLPVGPDTKKLAMGLNESLTLKLRKGFALFVGLFLPHANHNNPANRTEGSDYLRMVFELPF